MKNADYLKKELKDQQISQNHFGEEYYREEVNETADEKPIADHYERFKSLLKSSDHRAPERIMAYINYFNRTYKNENRYTQADRSAAWELFVELDTRVATRQLLGGESKAALSSLASLFVLHRDISKLHGPNCKEYYSLVNGYLERSLRPFTSKWHSELDDKADELFRNELASIQANLSELKDTLENMSA